MWLPLHAPAHDGQPEIPVAGRPVLPGSARPTTPYVRVRMRFLTEADYSTRTGEFGLTPLHWCALSVACRELVVPGLTPLGDTSVSAALALLCSTGR